jgi:hypothetical protein
VWERGREKGGNKLWEKEKKVPEREKEKYVRLSQQQRTQKERK